MLTSILLHEKTGKQPIKNVSNDPNKGNCIETTGTSRSSNLRFLQHKLAETSDSRHKFDFDWLKKDNGNLQKTKRGARLRG